MTATSARLYTCPMPPEALAQPGLGFARASEVEDFAARHFLDRDGMFFDPEHGHLTGVFIGILWASSQHVDKGSVKAGTAQLVKRGEPTKWNEAVQQVFMHQMFGAELPVFKITLSAPTWAVYNDRQRFELLDHELLHCGVKKSFGAPVFSEQTGQPVWKLRPHDFEGFVGSTERWGANASGAAGIVRAGIKPARFAWVPGTDLDIRQACGVT